MEVNQNFLYTTDNPIRNILLLNVKRVYKWLINKFIIFANDETYIKYYKIYEKHSIIHYSIFVYIILFARV